MKNLLLLLLLLTVAAPLGAQSCFELALQKGQTAYDAGNYPKARQYWEAGKDCDGADAKKLNNLIWKTRDDDNDGVVNGRDKCPNQYGKNKGCPPADPDEDGLTGADDDCPNQYGPRRFNGCPDKDGDDIPDHLDGCPTVFGPARTKGCPDRDGDGVPDKDDRCPDEAGTRPDGCKPRVAPPPTVTPTTTTAPAGFVLIKGGTFQMGDVMSDKEYTGETVHTVTVSDFYLAKHELTFDEYDTFCTATGRDKPSDNGWGRGQRPVINASWYDAVEYCNWRSQQDGRRPAYTIQGEQVTLNSGANGYRLPTEAEWEYAAREGGKKVRFGNGRNVIDPSEINFDASSSYKKTYSVVGEYRQKTVPVSDLSANALGLKNMSGNVWEWCQDWYATYPTAAQTNPTGPNKGANRVLRGGSWFSYPRICRAAYRRYDTPTGRINGVGFRLASPLQ